jgi:hypothetical protein
VIKRETNKEERKMMIINCPDSNTTTLAEKRDLSLSRMQGLVGGLIQPVSLEGGITLWCNEEGRLMGLPYNRMVVDSWGNSWKIYGPFFICSSVAEGEEEEGEAIGLTIPQAAAWLNRIRGMSEGHVE